MQNQGQVFSMEQTNHEWLASMEVCLGRGQASVKEPAVTTSSQLLFPVRQYLLYGVRFSEAQLTLGFIKNVTDEFSGRCRHLDGLCYFDPSLVRDPLGVDGKGLVKGLSG